jgi:hypothetical protein
MWFLSNKVLLTKDNLAKRNWNECTKCVFCGEQETVEHLFIDCPLAKLFCARLISLLIFHLQPVLRICLVIG